MRLTRRDIVIGTTLACLPLGAFAMDVPELNLSSSGLALRGIDPTSYFNSGKPLEGDPSITVEHKGGTYRFASEKARAAFLQSPDFYLPQYGGYCAYGTAVGSKVDGDPYRWNIVDDKLYLNINRPVDLLWKTNKSGYIADANKNWPGLKNQ